MYITKLISFFTLIFATLKGSEVSNRPPSYPYPSPGIIEDLENQGVESLTLFSYGSLMDPTSAARTLSQETLKTHKPAVAFGAKRIFNRDVPIETFSAWGVPCHEASRAMLNLFLTEDRRHLVNGVVLEIKLKDIPRLLEREKGYDLIPVYVTDWENFTEEEEPQSYLAYAFVAPLNSIYTHPAIYPRPNYYELTRDASKLYGPEFYNLWLASTYLSDGSTPIIEWEKTLKQQCPHTKTH